MATQKPKTKEQRRARRKVLERKPAREPDCMVACVMDQGNATDVVLELAGGKVSVITFPLDGEGGLLKMPASFLRAAVDMINDVDGER
jgi:hypothetical protein